MPRKPGTATVREQLQHDELARRDAAAKTTQFDEPATIVREGKRLIIPTNMSPETALKWVTNWVESEEKVVNVNTEIPGIPIDAAYALQQTVLHELGYSSLQATPGSFFRPDQPPTFMTVPIDHQNNTVDVYVGRMELPGFDKSWMSSSPSPDQMTLRVTAQVKKKDQRLLQQIFDAARERVRSNSLYKGRAFELELGAVDSDGDATMIIPRFWNLDEPKQLILNRDTEKLVTATVWTPIIKAALLRKHGINIKRGILLNGKFGTGKTLLAYRTAQIARDHGFTFAYIKQVSKLMQAFDFLQKNLAPGVIFCEDMDRAFEDPSQVNMIQNTLDGIDSKNSEIIVVMTTNFVEQIPPGVIRPGRIDTLINVDPPDSDAAGRLISLYGGEHLAANVDLEEVGRAIAGNIPAVIREVTERAKLYALAESDDISLTTTALLDSALGMEGHLNLLNRDKSGMRISPAALAGHALGMALGQSVREGIADAVSGKAFDGDRSATGADGKGKKIVN